MSNNSSSSAVSNPFRDEINQFTANVNFILAFIQAFICITGIFGNLLALIVINRKSLSHTSSAVFITYMAIFDSVVLLLHAAGLAKPGRNIFLNCSLTYLTDLAVFCANWVLVIITLERCVAVYSPFLAKRFCTVHSARHSMYILLSISIIFFSITFPLIYEMDKESKSKKCRVRPEARIILRVYQPIVFYAVPDIFLLSNLFTVCALCQRRHRLLTIYSADEQKTEIRICDANSNRKQRQLTIMLVTVSLSFYLFTTPAMVVYFIERHPLKELTLNRIKSRFLLGQISVIFLELNNATNFIFYCFAGQRFRQATKQTFYDYSAQLKTFYHRYMLCDKQYTATPAYQTQMSNALHTTETCRGSASPYHVRRNQHRTSTV